MIFMMATCKNGYVHLVGERRRDEANVPESCLNNLRYVTLAAAKVKGRDSLVIDLTTLLTFLSHKPMEQIRVNQFTLLEIQSANLFAVDVAHFGSNSIKSLILDYVNIDQDCLAPFFAGFRCLKRLEFHHAGDFRVLKDFNPAKFESVISHLKPSLEYLSLHQTLYPTRKPYDSMFLRSLREF